jgi:hypothetical protein
VITLSYGWGSVEGAPDIPGGRCPPAGGVSVGAGSCADAVKPKDNSNAHKVNTLKKACFIRLVFLQKVPKRAAPEITKTAAVSEIKISFVDICELIYNTDLFSAQWNAG